ncbi:MAG: sigma 54-interacting transcriptional regulator [Desulfovermiculus sp.]|nr:sigma 54-interacting transcriptional regulator [Desulfovermiculus sp.]
MKKTEKPSTKLLIIDDDPVVRESVAVYLEDSGFDVIEAEDGFQGLKLFRQSRPDVLLLDLRMPGMDGLDVLAEVSREDCDVPVIVITGVGVLQDAVSALRHGAFDFVTKPITDLAVLEHSVDNALNQTRMKKENEAYRSYLEEEVGKKGQSLEKRTQELEEANRQLHQEMAERIRSEEALRQSEKQLREIIGFFEGFIFTCTPEGTIDFMNDKLQAHLGSELGSGLCHELICAQDSPCSWCKGHLAVQGQTVRTEFFNPRDNCWYHVIHSPVFNAQGEIHKFQTIMIDITDRKQEEDFLRQSEAKWRKQSQRLQSVMHGSDRFMGIVGKSQAMHEVYEAMLKAANSNAHVIIYGESGTGKEMAAHTIHTLSERGERPFITVHCGALPENLIESEFFGYVKGAFTGAQTDKPGYLDAAHGGTLFMDEIGELGLNMQVKLLRAIEGQGYTPLGGREVKKADVRIIAATNKDLTQLMRAGSIRKDFFYRIHIIPITLPPLRQRPDDIPLLVHYFLQQNSDANQAVSLPKKVMQSMINYDWPGNVRELQNTIHRYLAFGHIDFFSPQEEGQGTVQNPNFGEAGTEHLKLQEVLEAREKEYIEYLLHEYRWHRSKVAEILGVDRRTLFRKMKTHGL